MLSGQNVFFFSGGGDRLIIQNVMLSGQNAFFKVEGGINYL